MLKCRYPVFEVDTVYFQAAVHELLSSILKRAIRAWYKEVWGDIPVWSGMAQAEFIPLGATIGDVPTAQTEIVFDTEGVRPSMGRSIGQDSFKIETGNGLYHFNFTVGVPHTNINSGDGAKQMNLKRPVPWQTFVKAAVALKNEIEMAMLETKLSQLLSESIHVTIKETR
jgi:hypothetical protein